MRKSAVRKEPVMANSLPMTLRVYQKLSSGLVPLAPALIKRRLKQGKEDPARVGERRGMSRDIRPHGPLVWIHGASVGEVLAAAALIERLRALNLRILLTSGTVTSAAIVAKRFPADIIHQYVPYDSRRYVERFMAVTRGRPIIVAASTHPGEEEIVVEAHRVLAGFFPSLLSVIVPRHPARGEAIARAIAASGLHVALRSREELPIATTDIYV